MNKILFALFFISFGCIGSCSNSNVNNAQNYSSSENLLDSVEDEKQGKTYSIEEEQKVYGDIRFGISKSQYHKLIKQRIIQIGEFKYEFIPKFNNKNELYELIIKGAEKTKDEYKNERANFLYVTDGPKALLIQLVQQRYGEADEVIEANKNLEFELYGMPHPNLARNSLEYDTYLWNVNNKKIRIFLACEVPGESNQLFIDFKNPKLRIYPVMRIINEKMALEVDSLENAKNTVNFEDEAKKF